MIVTKEELANRLDGCECGEEMSATDKSDAKESGLVVIFGYSDDNVEFRGAIEDELGCFGGATILIHQEGVLDGDHECHCEYCSFKSIKNGCLKLHAYWDDDAGYSWAYKISVPSASFDVMERGGKFCRGIIIDLESLPKAPKITQV